MRNGPFKSFIASSDFCHLLITFANSLDRQSWSGSKPFDTLIYSVPERIFLKKYFEKKKLADGNKHAKLPRMQRVDNAFSNP